MTVVDKKPTNQQDVIRISAGSLGEVIGCPRCFYIKYKCKKLPYQIFPGIFSSIDSFTKNVVIEYSKKYKKFPNWLQENVDHRILSNNVKSKMMKWVEPKTGILLTGVPDEVLELEDQTYSIVDHKTARLTDSQLKHIGRYYTQLNVYSLLFEQLNNVKVSKLSLNYMEPDNKIDSIKVDTSIINHDPKGIYLRFDSKYHEVPKDYDKYIYSLLFKAKEILSGSVPQASEKCKNCSALDNIFSFLKDRNAI